MPNCVGCKWLDSTDRRGSGYCCMVERSRQGQAHREHLSAHRDEYELGRVERPSIRKRTPDTVRCELYEAGDYATRYGGGEYDV